MLARLDITNCYASLNLAQAKNDTTFGTNKRDDTGQVCKKKQPTQKNCTFVTNAMSFCSCQHRYRRLSVIKPIINTAIIDHYRHDRGKFKKTVQFSRSCKDEEAYWIFTYEMAKINDAVTHHANVG